MESFKVICKADGKDWQRMPTPTKVVISRHWWYGKSTKIVDDPQFVNGPSKDEICIVTDSYVSGEETYYILAGYPYGGYHSKNFIRLDELTETQKEIAEKSQPVFN